MRDEEHGYWAAVTTTRRADLVLETRRAGQVVACDILRPKGEAVRIEAAVWNAPDGRRRSMRQLRASRPTG